MNSMFDWVYQPKWRTPNTSYSSYRDQDSDSSITSTPTSSNFEIRGVSAKMPSRPGRASVKGMTSLLPVINELQNVFQTAGMDSIDLPQIVVIGSQVPSLQFLCNLQLTLTAIEILTHASIHSQQVTSTNTNMEIFILLL